MKTVVYQNVTYHCPFSERFVRHVGEELEWLDESDRFHYPVLIYRDATLDLDNCVLDGEGRLESALRTGAAIEFRHLGNLSHDEATRQADLIFYGRRHQSLETVRRKRQERVAQKRSEGKSLRTIAAEEGISESQVRNDLKTAGAQSTAHLPETVKGQDGKEYPATRPTPPASPYDFDIPFDDTVADKPPAPPAPPPLPPPKIPPPPPEYPKPVGGPAPPPEVNGHRRVDELKQKKVAPDHPFAEALNALSNAARALTKVINSPEGQCLKLNLTHISAVYRKTQMVDYGSDVIDDGELKPGEVRFCGFRALRHVVKVCIRKELTGRELAQLMAEAERGEV